MTVKLRCILLLILDKWRRNTVSSSNVVRIWLQTARKNQFPYGRMGTHVHQVIFWVGLPSVDEMVWRSCACNWYVLTWLSVMHFSIQHSRTIVEESFWQTLCFHIRYRNVLSPTEVVQLDASLLTLLGAWHCNKGSNASIDFSHEFFHLHL